MKQSNNPEISTFEKLERIENRLKELSDIQKYLFDKYLEVAESDPIYQDRLHGLLKELKGIEIQDATGVTTDWKEMRKRLDIEEKQVKIEHLKLKNQQIALRLKDGRLRSSSVTDTAVMPAPPPFVLNEYKVREKKAPYLNHLVNYGSLIALFSVLIIGVYLIAMSNSWGYLLTVFAANLLAFRKFTLRLMNLDKSGETKD